MNGSFTDYRADDVRDLVAEYPLAWITATGAEPGAGTRGALLPLLGEYDGEGRLVSLLGHMARRNPLHGKDGAPLAVTILVTGPQAYISPAQAEKRDWAPSWNYAQLVIDADLEFLPDETEPAVAALVEAMEHGAWTSADLGSRYPGMLGPIIGFRATVRRLNGRFKLGQDESPTVFAAICRNHPDAALVRWMQRFDR